LFLFEHVCFSRGKYTPSFHIGNEKVLKVFPLCLMGVGFGFLVVDFSNSPQTHQLKKKRGTIQHPFYQYEKKIIFSYRLYLRLSPLALQR
ncbi:MAG: hypothetical protein RL609_685, partial [Bacteroidota bacterium]